MQHLLLTDLLRQNRLTCSYALDRITEENFSYRLTPQCASVGFIHRHLAETINLFGHFFGLDPEVENTTIGQIDTGQVYSLESSRELIERGFIKLQGLIDRAPDEQWGEEVETPFFGRVSRVRLLAHVLYHNAHHCGQLAMTINHGRVFDESSKPAGYTSLSPYLMVDEAPRLVELLQTVFGAEPLRRFDRPDGSLLHAEVRIEDSVLMLSGATAEYPVNSSMLHVYVSDAAAVYQRALTAGCTSLGAPEIKEGDTDKRGGFRDFAGNDWYVATQQGR